MPSQKTLSLVFACAAAELVVMDGMESLALLQSLPQRSWADATLLSVSDSAATADVNGTWKVKIEVHYETKCPDCEAFLGGPFYDIWQNKEMRERLDVKLVPAGNVYAIPMAEISEGYRFWHPESVNHEWAFMCQHGDEECFGNLVQTCVMNRTLPETYVPFVACMANSTTYGYGIEKGVYECLLQIPDAPSNVAPDHIRACIATKDANELMYENIMLGQVRNISYVPWILIEDSHDIDTDVVDSSTLLAALCPRFSEPWPYRCRDWYATAVKESQHKR